MPRFQIGHFLFCPAFWPTLVCGVFFIVFINLGVWQANRAVYKQNLQEQFQQGEQADPLSDIKKIVELGGDVQGFPVSLQGEVGRRNAVLLDNQIRNKVAGYHVLSPFHVPGQGWILVNRGWLAGNLDRSLPDVPELNMGESPSKIVGKIYFPSEKQVVLKEETPLLEKGRLRVQKLDLPSIGEALGVELAPFVVRADPDLVMEIGEQLPREWQFIVMSAAKSRAYSLQWFAMALALLGMYLFFSTEKKPPETD